MNCTIDIGVESSFAGVRKVAGLAREVIADRADAEEIYAIELALVEACTNAVRYGRAAQIHVVLKVVDGMLEFQVENEGDPFQMSNSEFPTFREDEPETFPTGGMGVPLIRHIMDSVDYQADDGVNKVTMQKRLPKAHVEEARVEEAR